MATAGLHLLVGSPAPRDWALATAGLLQLGVQLTALALCQRVAVAAPGPWERRAAHTAGWVHLGALLTFQAYPVTVWFARSSARWAQPPAAVASALLGGASLWLASYALGGGVAGAALAHCGHDATEQAVTACAAAAAMLAAGTLSATRPEQVATGVRRVLELVLLALVCGALGYTAYGAWPLADAAPNAYAVAVDRTRADENDSLYVKWVNSRVRLTRRNGSLVRYLVLFAAVMNTARCTVGVSTSPAFVLAKNSVALTVTVGAAAAAGALSPALSPAWLARLPTSEVADWMAYPGNSGDAAYAKSAGKAAVAGEGWEQLKGTWGVAALSAFATMALDVLLRS